MAKQEFFQSMECTDAYFYELDVEGRFVRYNDAFLALFSKEQQEALVEHKTWSELDSGLFSTYHIRQRDMQVITHDVPMLTEECYLGDGGHWISVFSQKIPVRKSGELVGMINYATPINNDSDKLVYQQRTAMLVLQQLLDSIPGHIYWKTRQGVYIGCNDKQARSLGFKSGAEVIGKTDYHLPWPESSADVFRRHDQHVLRSGVPMLVEEVATMDGEEVIVLSQKIPLRNHTNSVIGLVGISMDITQKKVYEQIKSRLINEMKSDVCEPCHSVCETLEAMLDQEEDTDKKEQLRKSKATIEEVLARCDHILNFSKSDLGLNE